jgi:hypothetical protein
MAWRKGGSYMMRDKVHLRYVIRQERQRRTIQGVSNMAKRNKPDMLDQTVERIYGTYCSGMQISVLRIPELFRLSRALLIGGATDETVGQWMINFVNGRH